LSLPLKSLRVKPKFDSCPPPEKFECAGCLSFIWLLFCPHPACRLPQESCRSSGHAGIEPVEFGMGRFADLQARPPGRQKVPHQRVQKDGKICVHRTARYGSIPRDILGVQRLAVNLSGDRQKTNKRRHAADKAFRLDFLLVSCNIAKNTT